MRELVVTASGHLFPAALRSMLTEVAETVGVAKSSAGREAAS